MSELSIVFNNNYPKLHEQTEARLVAVFNAIPGELLYKKFPDLVGYDTRRNDGKFYGIQNSQEYMLLLFVGNKGILFSTLRKSNDENIKLYNDSIGELYKLEIKET